MPCIIGIDLSTCTGYSVFVENKLVDYGNYNIKNERIELNFKIQDYVYIYKAKKVAKFIQNLVKKNNPDLIVIEQTNAGSFRLSQKQLEFIHFAVLTSLENKYSDKIIYIDTSKWRKMLGIRLSKEQKKHNKNIKNKDKIKIGANMPKGKITPKHLSVMYVNNKFGLKLKLKDNDIADAICIGDCGNILFDQFNKQKSLSDSEITKILLNE